MGGKASNVFADVIMNYIADKALEITPSQYKPFLFCVYRYVDDCFGVFNDKNSVIGFEKMKTVYTPTLLLQQKCNPTIV